MTTALQNKAWSVLPKEFKKEVKKIYSALLANIKMYQGDNPDQVGTTDPILWERTLGIKNTLCRIFGKHNLTSDAEGEVELLHVTRQKVMGLYANAKKLHDLYTNATCINEAESRAIDSTAGTMSVLKTLFGSKCLPDEDKECSNPSVVNCKHKHGDGTCSLGNMCCHKSLKPAEPKFKVGDKVKDISSPHDDGIYKVDDIKKSSDGFLYHIQGLIGVSNVKESDLEPYTEPKKGSRNLSQETANYDKQFDNILKDSFRSHNRLQLAAQIAQGALSNPNVTKSCADFETNQEYIAKTALMYADALIKECEHQ